MKIPPDFFPYQLSALYKIPEIYFYDVKRINRPDDLLWKHAADGDPGAFFAIFREPVRNAYVLIRGKGINEAQAAATLIPFIRKLYRRFVRTRPGGSADEWFRVQIRRLPVAAQENDSDTFDLEQIDPPGLARFEASLQLVLQREYAHYRDNHGLPIFKGEDFGHRAARKGLLFVVLAAGLYALFLFSGFLLRSFDTRIDFTLSLPSHVLKFSFPSGKTGAHKAAADVPATENNSDGHSGMVPVDFSGSDSSQTGGEATGAPVSSGRDIPTPAVTEGNPPPYSRHEEPTVVSERAAVKNETAGRKAEIPPLSPKASGGTGKAGRSAAASVTRSSTEEKALDFSTATAEPPEKDTTNKAMPPSPPALPPPPEAPVGTE
jgi:hypothetical protein